MHVEYLTRALERETDRVGRAEVLVELGLAERLTNGPAAVDLRAALEVCRHDAEQLPSRSSWAAPSGSPTGSRMPLQSSSGLSTRSTTGRTPTSTNCSGGADQRVMVARADVSHRRGGGRRPQARCAPWRRRQRGAAHDLMAHYEARLGLHRELAVKSARRALASGKLMASGSVAFYYAVNVLPLGLARGGGTYSARHSLRLADAGTSSTSGTYCSGVAGARPFAAIFGPRLPI